MNFNINVVKDSVFGLIVSLSLVGLLGTSIYLDHIKEPPSIKTPSAASVQLVEKGKGFCSGTFVEGGYADVLTARHCVKEVGQTITIPYKGFDYDYVVTKISDLSDLAVLKPKEDYQGLADIQKIKISGTAYYEEKSWAIGYALGASKTITEGYLGAIDSQPFFGDISKSTAFQRATVLIAPGNSGGGLFQIEDGEFRLVGVATGINKQFFFVTYYTPLEEIKDFLDG